jgi:hypothetical protein
MLLASFVLGLNQGRYGCPDMLRQAIPDLNHLPQIGVLLQRNGQASGIVAFCTLRKYLIPQAFTVFGVWFCKPAVIGSIPIIGFCCFPS